MRYFLLFSISALSFVFSACTAEQPNTPQSIPCDYTVADHAAPQFATYAHEMNIPYNQERLVQFMWVDLDQSECFAKQFAPVKIYRVPFIQDNGVFQKLPEAPTKAINSWKHFEASSGSALKGLTTFSFESGTNEKIIESFMLVRADASQWHLWHEFSHFIIGTERANHHDHNLQIAEKSHLYTLQSQLLNPPTNEQEYSQQLQSFFNTNHEYIIKRFLDEMVIESTLIFLALQNAGTPEITDNDIQNSINMILFFSMQFASHTTDNLNTIAQIRSQQPLTSAQKELVDMAENRILLQKVNIDRMIHDVNKKAQKSIF